MNRDIAEGKWKQMTGKVKEEWGDLTDDEIQECAGRSEKLAGKLQEHYGYSKEEAEQRIDSWQQRNNI